MGLNDEYSRDAFQGDNYAYDSDDQEEVLELGPEDWQDMNSQELLDAWMSIRAYIEQYYIKTTATYPDFIELVLQPIKWNTTAEPTPFQRRLWDLVARQKVVRDNVDPENFYAWSDNYIGQC
jgi:hypothetical protein